MAEVPRFVCNLLPPPPPARGDSLRSRSSPRAHRHSPVSCPAPTAPGRAPSPRPPPAPRSLTGWGCRLPLKDASGTVKEKTLLQADVQAAMRRGAPVTIRMIGRALATEQTTAIRQNADLSSE